MHDSEHGHGRYCPKITRLTRRTISKFASIGGSSLCHLGHAQDHSAHANPGDGPVLAWDKTVYLLPLWQRGIQGELDPAHVRLVGSVDAPSTEQEFSNELLRARIRVVSVRVADDHAAKANNGTPFLLVDKKHLRTERRM